MADRLVCGIHAVRQLLRTRPGDVRRVYVQEGLAAERLGRLTGVLDRAPEVVRCPAGELERLSGHRKHQGVVAVAEALRPLGEAEARTLVEGLDQPLLLVLDGVQDPRNFGACLRTADAAGADLVVVPRSRNVAVTAVVSKVAAGAAETQPVAQVGNLARFMEDLKACGVWFVGADAAAGASLYDTDLSAGTALVLGAEGEGLRRLTRERCDLLARLPMLGSVESLNVAVAAGICLYECLRQRSARLPGAPAVQ